LSMAGKNLSIKNPDKLFAYQGCGDGGN